MNPVSPLVKAAPLDTPALKVVGPRSYPGGLTGKVAVARLQGTRHHRLAAWTMNPLGLLLTPVTDLALVGTGISLDIEIIGYSSSYAFGSEGVVTEFQLNSGRFCTVVENDLGITFLPGVIGMFLRGCRNSGKPILLSLAELSGLAYNVRVLRPNPARQLELFRALYRNVVIGLLF